MFSRDRESAEISVPYWPENSFGNCGLVDAFAAGISVFIASSKSRRNPDPRHSSG